MRRACARGCCTGEAIKLQTAVISNGEGYCILNELKAYAGAAFPYATEATLAAALTAFVDSAAFAAIRIALSDFDKKTGFVLTADRSGVQTIYNSFNTTMPIGLPLMPRKIAEYYDPLRKAVDDTCAADGWNCVLTNYDGVGGGSGSYFYWMSTLRELATEAVNNIVIALAVSYVVLVVVTRNVLVPAMAIVSIGSTVTCVLATIFLLGFKFDANAAILIVIAVGLAVDYAVHFTHFYNECHGARYEKAQSAIHAVGISVIMGAVTTGGGAVPLIFTDHFLFFREGGWFIFFTAVYGLLFAFFQLIPLLMVVGPQYNSGDVAEIKAWIGAKLGQSKGSVTGKTASSTSSTDA